MLGFALRKVARVWVQKEGFLGEEDKNIC